MRLITGAFSITTIMPEGREPSDVLLRECDSPPNQL